jgi:hypothetical protein
MSADGRYSPVSAVKGHRCSAAVESAADRMTSAASAAAREDGVRARQQRHAQQNRNHSSHWSLLFAENPAPKKCNAGAEPA